MLDLPNPNSIYMASLLRREKELMLPRLLASEDPSRREKARVSRATARSLPSWLCAVLQIPVEMKLLGANLMITIVAVVLLFGPVRLEPDRLTDAVIVGAAFGIGSLVNFVLVRLALSPVNSITQVAWLVSQGLLGARVPASITADRHLAHLSVTINALLDDLVQQRARISKLSGEPVERGLGVVRSGETRDASLARPLR